MSTCVRHAKELLGIDLGACTNWLRCIEVHYQRPPTSLSPDDTESTEARISVLATAVVAGFVVGWLGKVLIKTWIA